MSSVTPNGILFLSEDNGFVSRWPSCNSSAKFMVGMANSSVMILFVEVGVPWSNGVGLIVAPV